MVTVEAGFLSRDSQVTQTESQKGLKYMLHWLTALLVTATLDGPEGDWATGDWATGNRFAKTHSKGIVFLWDILGVKLGISINTIQSVSYSVYF